MEKINEKQKEGIQWKIGVLNDTVGGECREHITT